MSILFPEKFALALCEGVPCVAYATTALDRPLVVTHHWPISRENAPREHWESLGLVFGKILRNTRTGSGVFEDRDGMSYEKKAYRLIDGPGTKSILRTEEPATLPRGARPRRGWIWEKGRWIRRNRYGTKELSPAEISS